MYKMDFLIYSLGVAILIRLGLVNLSLQLLSNKLTRVGCERRQKQSKISNKSAKSVRSWEKIEQD